MKKVRWSKFLFLGVTGLLLLPYLVYAFTSASVSVSINGAVNGATSDHSWSTDHPQYQATYLDLTVRDITNGEPGDFVGNHSKTLYPTSGSDDLWVNWTPVAGNTYKATARTDVVDDVGGSLAQAEDTEEVTK